ncbi:uncharacterized protein LOC117789639 isoform X2 [Drosophila innubila]|uniref:uncharacterized protein LOC117789639 isoform X2 n=1 Tax=Drosophila innubila TaxID=198719 RepID=UPI00148B7FDA|nr:uncharacterized protein LOC117789639 isoform X2 [Drosophila innubila]
MKKEALIVNDCQTSIERQHKTMEIPSSKPENPNPLLAIPKWINEDYFRPIIEKDVTDFVRIKNFTSIAATKAGDNFSSIMVRVIVDIELKDGSEQEMSYILKTVLENSKGGSMFPRETNMYQTQIPNFIRLYKEAGVDVQLGPKCVHIDENPDGITIVMEDLKRQKFQNVDRTKGLDMEHMRGVLHKAAELHAASAVTYEQNGPFNEMYNHTLYNENHRERWEKVLKLRNVQYIQAMREWQLPDVEKYIAKVLSPRETFDIGKRLSKVDENEFNCLNHGDLWCNNVMFSEDRTLLIDFQLVKWGSPAHDLWYLIASSSSLDIKITEFDHFIEIYHTRLVECLKLLKYSKPIPTLRELHIMMLKYGDLGMITATGILVIALLPHDKNFDINNYYAQGPEGDDFRYKAFSNPYYVKAMLQLNPFLNNKGLL